jgi:hypothetical protein
MYKDNTKAKQQKRKRLLLSCAESGGWSERIEKGEEQRQGRRHRRL